MLHFEENSRENLRNLIRTSENILKKMLIALIRHREANERKGELKYFNRFIIYEASAAKKGETGASRAFVRRNIFFLSKLA